VRRWLRKGQRVRYVARGGSMWPTIRDGALVEVVPCEASALRVGTIGAFEGSDGIVVHRVIGCTSESIWFRGDANGTPDGWIQRARVLGVVQVLRQGKLLGRGLRLKHAKGLVHAARWWLRLRRGRM
jgi:hypothetical protein